MEARFRRSSVRWRDFESPKRISPKAATARAENPRPARREALVAGPNMGGSTHPTAITIRGKSRTEPTRRSSSTVAKTLLAGTRPLSPAITDLTTAPAWAGRSMLERKPTPVARKQSP